MFEKRRKSDTVVCYVRLFADDDDVILSFRILLDNLLAGCC